jgi:hypothetical protein
MSETLEDYKTKQMLKQSVDPERIRGGINKMIEQQLDQRGPR